MATIANPARPATLPTADVHFIDVPDRRCFMIDGLGIPDLSTPGSVAFQEAIQALYGVAYTLHFTLKRRGIDAGVGTLEGLWTLPEASVGGDAAALATPADAAGTAWTAIMPIPDEATDDEIAASIDDLRRKKAPPALDRMRVETLREGRAAEVLHIGPYDVEGPTIARLHAAIADAGLRPIGRHHEIYIGDPRRASPARLRTVIRQPVA